MNGIKTTISPAQKNTKYQGGENIDLNDIFLSNRHLTFNERMHQFSLFVKMNEENKANLYRRKIVSAPRAEVWVQDIYTGSPRKMLMFGSNNYLGLATHPYVVEKVKKAIDKYGVGIGGPPLLNGYTILHEELEERLAALKHAESAMLFSSGYNANVGLVTGLINTKKDLIIYDQYSHASLSDGIKMARAESIAFAHNDTAELEIILANLPQEKYNNVFIAVEGVYSMDGDLVPLTEISTIGAKYGAVIILDDAHGTLILGKNGHGTAEHFGVESAIGITMGTFSKAFAVTGGFVASSGEVIDYLRFFARSYMFSASLPIPVVAAVLAGIEITEKEPFLRENLLKNVNYAREKLRKFGLVTEPEAAIITLRVPGWMNIREASYLFHEKGIFINSIEFPAVPLNEQRYRISIMSGHNYDHIDRLVEVVDHVWKMSGML